MILTPLALAFLPPDSAQHAARHLFQHGILSVLLGAGRVSKKVFKEVCVCVLCCVVLCCVVLCVFLLQSPEA